MSDSIRLAILRACAGDMLWLFPGQLDASRLLPVARLHRAVYDRGFAEHRLSTAVRLLLL